MSAPDTPEVGPVVVTRLGGPLGAWRAGSPSLCTFVFVRGGEGCLCTCGAEIPLMAGDVFVLAPYAHFDEHGLATLDGYLVDVRECALGLTWRDADPAIMAAVHGLARPRGETSVGREPGPVVRLSPEECAEWEARLRSRGVEVVHRTAWTIYVRDPEGNRIGLSHHPDAAEAP